MSRLVELVKEYKDLGITEQIDYEKLYMYSIVTNSTAVEGSTITEIENMLMFDEGISPNRSLAEQLMNLDLKNAYVEAFALAEQHTDYSVRLLCHLAAMVMNNTGIGELRLLNVTAGRGGKSYVSYQKVPQRLEEFCTWLNFKRNSIDSDDTDRIWHDSVCCKEGS
ncbi:MAG: hypothetical protein K6F17_03080 [Lachnospiraceae bacterium]|nr:hypothetical protein [Lachnospiraceae bacterium]